MGFPSQTFISLISSLLSRCPFPSERQARLEAVREVFLAAYSSTVGLKSSAPSPSGAISGLLEQFARGVGLRGGNAIVWTLQCDFGPSCLHPVDSACLDSVQVPNTPVQFRGEALFYFTYIFLWLLHFILSCGFFYFISMLSLSHSGREVDSATQSKRDININGWVWRVLP